MIELLDHTIIFFGITPANPAILWVEERILFLGEVFYIDASAYASNYNHVALYINIDQAKSLTNLEVCERWHHLYKGTLLRSTFCSWRNA